MLSIFHEILKYVCVAIALEAGTSSTALNVKCTFCLMHDDFLMTKMVTTEVFQF